MFDHYLDGVRYEKRPSAWVEPIGDWGRGAIQLVEIPTNDEIHDNIVADWKPENSVIPGSHLDLAYRVHWYADEPFPSPLARCVATRLGRGGQPGQDHTKSGQKFIVEFLGGPLANLPYGVRPEPVLWSSRGAFTYATTAAVPDYVPGHWRAEFDLVADGASPIEMRLYLRSNGEALSETWLYQYHPLWAAAMKW